MFRSVRGCNGTIYDVHIEEFSDFIQSKVDPVADFAYNYLALIEFLCAE